MSGEFVDMLQNFLSLDLTERETKIYTTLLSKQGFTAAELQQTVQLPSSKIYDVLKRMVARGLCTERFIDGVKYYEAVNPEIAFKRVLNKYESELENKVKVVNQLISSLTPVFKENRDLVNPLDFIEIIKDKRLILQRYNDYMINCKTEMIGFNKGPYVASSSDQIEEEIDAEGDFLKRGGSVRTLYETGEFSEFDFLMYVAKESRIKGEQIRVADSLPIKMLIFDERYVMLPLQAPISPTTVMTICIEHPQLARAFKTLFEFIWATGKSFDDFLSEFEIAKESSVTEQN